jgi:hypothetical protein
MRQTLHASAAGLVTAVLLVSAMARADEVGPSRAVPQPAGPAAPEGDVRSARVHVQSAASAPLVLETHAPGSAVWTSCCRSPCDVDLPVDRDYRVSADGIRPSSCLRLSPPPGAAGVVLDVHPVSRKTHTAGLVLVGVGLVLFTVGDAMSDVFLALEAAKVADKQQVPAIASEIIVPGLIIAAVGAVAFGTGGVLFLTTREPTTVVQSPAPVVVHDLARASLPTFVSLPLVSGTF